VSGPSDPWERETVVAVDRPFPSTASEPLGRCALPTPTTDIASRNPASFARPVRAVQCKLTVGAAEDAYEQEADRVANEVMSASGRRTPIAQASPPPIQRRCTTCEEDETLRRKPLGDASPNVPHAAIDLLRSTGGVLLPAATLAFMQTRLGHDFSSARMHDGPLAAESAAALEARAFTVGHDVVFNRGEYAPFSNVGQTLIAHELAHVVQQSVYPAAPMVQRQPAAAKPKSWTGPSRCGPDFCQPFATVKEATDDRDDLLSLHQWRALRLGIGAKVSSKVLPLWDEWAAGGGPVRDITPTFGLAFTSSPTTRDTTNFLLGEIKTAVAAHPIAPGTTAKVALSALIPSAVAAIDTPGGPNEMNFNIPGDIPGNLAGGVGKDEAADPVGATPSPQDDARIARGDVLIFGSSGGGQTVMPSLSYTVKDTVDLCPGDCGASLEQIATIPMSRWEATGISGDVPYTVDFTPPLLLTLPFAVPSPGPSAPTPAPAGPTSAPANDDKKR